MSSEDITLLIPFLYGSVLWFLAWLVLWRKKSRRWPIGVALLPCGLVALVIAFGLVPFIFLLPAALGVILTVGLLKLLVEGAGRRNVFASSTIRASQPKAPPRGLVESRGDEDL